MKTLTTQEQRLIKDHFERRVDRKSRKSMVDFLTNHFQYYTMSSWNRSTSYAHNIKLPSLHGVLPNDIEETAWAMLSCPEWNSHMSCLMHIFDEANCYTWQVGVNGRSDGYIVLYQGGINNSQQFCRPGQSLDQDEDFYEWDMDKLRARFDLICDFDMLASDITIDFVSFCRTYNVVEKTIMVPKKVQVLRDKVL